MVHSIKYKVQSIIFNWIIPVDKVQKSEENCQKSPTKSFGALLYEEACIGLPLKGAFVSRAYVVINGGVSSSHSLSLQNLGLLKILISFKNLEIGFQFEHFSKVPQRNQLNRFFEIYGKIPNVSFRNGFLLWRHFQGVNLTWKMDKFLKNMAL